MSSLQCIWQHQILETLRLRIGMLMMVALQAPILLRILSSFDNGKSPLHDDFGKILRVKVSQEWKLGTGTG